LFPIFEGRTTTEMPLEAFGVPAIPRALVLCLGMIFSETRFTLFRIVP
jgi:hypothetical protein